MTTLTAPVLAHAGHWAAGLLYLAPVLIVVVVLAWQGRKERRQRRTRHDLPTQEGDEP